MTELIAYWLIPAGPYRRWAADQIAAIAHALNGPIFEPHVTIYSEPMRSGVPVPLLAAAAKKIGRISLHPLRIDYSAKFTKTLYIEFAPSASLMQLSEHLRESSREPSEEKLKPHLSLAYKHLRQRDRALLAEAIVVPFKTMIFNEIAAVVCPAHTTSGTDVRAWRVVQRQAI